MGWFRLGCLPTLLPCGRLPISVPDSFSFLPAWIDVLSHGGFKHILSLQNDSLA